MMDSLNAVDLHIMDPIARRTDLLDWKTKLSAELNEYTNALVAELSR